MNEKLERETVNINSPEYPTSNLKFKLLNYRFSRLMEEIGGLCKRRFEEWEWEEAIIEEDKEDPTPELSQISYPSQIPGVKPSNSRNQIV